MSLKEEHSQDHLLPHPIWSPEEVDNVEITHREPRNLTDRLALYTVLSLRRSFDLASGYTIGKTIGVIDERAVLIRCIFLETVAGALQVTGPGDTFTYTFIVQSTFDLGKFPREDY